MTPNTNPAPLDLEGIREKIVMVDALVHSDCPSKDKHSHLCERTGEVLGLWDQASTELARLREHAPAPAAIGREEFERLVDDFERTVRTEQLTREYRGSAVNETDRQALDIARSALLTAITPPPAPTVPEGYEIVPKGLIWVTPEEMKAYSDWHQDRLPSPTETPMREARECWDVKTQGGTIRFYNKDEAREHFGSLVQNAFGKLIHWREVLPAQAEPSREGTSRVLVAIESPFSGDVERNIRYARACMRDSISRGEAPIASHLLYTQPGILDDEDHEEREIGIECGFLWNRHAEKVVVYQDLGNSRGMLKGIADAEARGAEIEYRTIGAGEWQAQASLGDRQEAETLALAKKAADAFGEWNESEDQALDGATLNALHELHDAFYNPPDGIPIVAPRPPESGEGVVS